MSLYIDIQKFRNNYLEIQKYNTIQENIFVSVNIPCTTSLTINSNIFKKVYGNILINASSLATLLPITKKYGAYNINGSTSVNVISLLKNISKVNIDDTTSITLHGTIKNIGTLNVSNISFTNINTSVINIGTVNTNCISNTVITSILRKYSTEYIDTATFTNINTLLKNVGAVSVISMTSTHIESLTKIYGKTTSYSATTININGNTNRIKEIYNLDIIFDGAIKYILTSYSEMNNKQYSNLFLLNYEQIEKKDKRFIITDQNYPIKHVLNKGQNFDIDFDFTMKNSKPYILDRNFPIKVVV